MIIQFAVLFSILLIVFGKPIVNGIEASILLGVLGLRISQPGFSGIQAPFSIVEAGVLLVVLSVVGIQTIILFKILCVNGRKIGNCVVDALVNIVR